MRGPFVISILLVIAVAMAGTVTVVAAGGTGPDDARVPSGEWESIEAGEEHWYAFQYQGDGSQIQVLLEAVPEEGASFSVWTPEEARRWRAGSEVEPIGRGSPDPAAPGKLVWTGRFNDKGTYYAVIESSTGQPGTTYYLLTVSGDGVWLSASPSTIVVTPEPARPKQMAPTAPKGTLVFQTSVGGDIYSINADGSGLQRITYGMDPTWSPDGKRLALIRWTEPRGVWVVDVETGNEWRAFDWSSPRWTSWSPEGDEILFSRVMGGRQEPVEFCFRGFCFTFPANPHWKMGVVRSDGSSFFEPKPPQSLTSRAPDWSPAGDRVVFADIQGLRVQNLDGSDSFQITADSRDTSPIWSPDGNQIAFVRRMHDHWDLYVVDASGDNLLRLTDTPKKPNSEVANSASPVWSPDGNSIAFLTDRTGEWEIWIMGADGSGQRPMFDTALEDLTLEYASLGERAISWTK
jgi:TolB protein